MTTEVRRQYCPSQVSSWAAPAEVEVVATVDNESKELQGRFFRYRVSDTDNLAVLEPLEYVAPPEPEKEPEMRLLYRFIAASILTFGRFLDRVTLQDADERTYGNPKFTQQVRTITRAKVESAGEARSEWVTVIGPKGDIERVGIVFYPDPIYKRVYDRRRSIT